MNINVLPLIIILFIIIIYSQYKISNIYDNFYEGLWIAPDYFCEKVQIDGMMIYIGPGDNERKCYIIMYSGNDVIFDKKINIKFKNKVSNLLLNQKVYKTIYLEGDDISKVMPLVQNVELDLVEGRMTWYSTEDDTIYAELFKDNISSRYGKLE